MEYINQKLRKQFGLNKYRPSIKMRKDAFFDFVPNQENGQDNQVLRKLSYSIIDLSEICFSNCIDVTYSYYTIQQDKCISRCVKDYFDGFLSIAQQTNKRVKEYQTYSNKLEK